MCVRQAFNKIRDEKYIFKIYHTSEKRGLIRREANSHENEKLKLS